MLLQVAGVGWDVPTMNSAVKEGMNWTVLIGGFLASSFIAVKFGWEYFKYSLGAAQGNDVKVTWDWQEIVRVLFIMLLLGSYVPLATGVTDALRGINSITNTSSSMHGELRDVADKYFMESVGAEKMETVRKLNALKNEDNDPQKRKIIDNFVDREYGVMNGTVNGGDIGEKPGIDGAVEDMTGENGSSGYISQLLASGFNSLTYLLSSIVKWIIGTFIKMVFQIGLVFGPIVLAFGIFFRDKPMNYMNQMLTLGFVFTTLNILDMLFWNFVKHTFNDPSVSASIAFNLAMIGAYLSAFKITNMFVGISGINSIMGRGLGVAATGAAAVLGGIGMAAGGGASGGGAIAKKAGQGIESAKRTRLD